MPATNTSAPAAPDAKTDDATKLLTKADQEQSGQYAGLLEPGEQPPTFATNGSSATNGSVPPSSLQTQTSQTQPDQNQQPQQPQRNPLADGSSYLPVSQSMWGAPAHQALEAARQTLGAATQGDRFSLAGMPGSEDGSFSLDQVPGAQGKTEGMSVNDLKGMSTGDARDYIKKHNDISSDDAATFLNQRAIDDDASQSQNDKASVFANDVSNAFTYWNQHIVPPKADAGSIIKAVVDPNGIGENFLNGVMGFAKGLGIEGRTWLQAVGNQDPTPFYARLDQRLANGSISQSDYNTYKTLLDKVTQIGQDRLAKGIGGTFETPESIREEQLEQAQKAMLLMQVDPDLARNQVAQATQNGLMGLELHGDQVKGAIEGAGSLFRPGSIDVTKLLGGDSMFSHMSHDQIKSLIDSERQVYVPMEAHQNAQALSADQTGGKIVNWDPNVKAIGEWWNNTARDMGLAPKYSAFASPGALAQEGLSLDPLTVQSIADNHTQLLAALLAENPEMAEAMEGLTSAGLKGAAGLTRAGNWTLGQFNAFSRGGKLGWITPILDGLHALYGGDPAAATFSVARDIALERGLPFVNKWGRIAADNLDSMATNQYNGSPLWWQLGSRGTRLTADSVTKSLPYAMLTSGGDPKQFMDNMGQLVPLHLLTGVPKVGLSSVAGSTGDALWGKTEQGKATRNLFPGEQPEPSFLQRILFGGKEGQITRMKPTEGYGVDDQLDKESNNNIAVMNTNDANTAITAQHFLKGTTDVYYVTPNTMQAMQNRFGANAQMTPRGLFIEPRLTGTGRSAAFVDINHLHDALPHEVVGHSVYYGLPDAIKQQVGDGVIKDGDPDAFIKNNYGQNVSYDSLPDHPDPADPGALSKDMVREEMSVEEIGRYFNNGNIAQYYKAKPTLLEKMRIASGSFLERMGFPSSTWESTSPMGINPGFARATDYAGYMRQLAKNSLKNPPIDPNWPTQWPKSGETVADTQARRAAELGQVPNAPQPANVNVPNVPPSEENIAKRAYEISKTREATNTPGDATSDWLQAEHELKSGAAKAPETGPEAPRPGTPGADTDEHHAQLEELIEKGMPAGEAQAVIEGRAPKTIEDETTGPKPMPQGGGRPVWQPGGGISGRIASIATPFVVRGQEEAARHPPPLNQGPELVGTQPQTTEQLTKTKPVAPEAPTTALDLSQVKGSEGAEKPKAVTPTQQPVQPKQAPEAPSVKEQIPGIKALTNDEVQEPKIDTQSNGYTSGRSEPLRNVILHSTDGNEKSDVPRLTTSGQVGVHYYVTKDGRVSHFVNDSDSAWQAGKDRKGGNANAYTLGIEQEHVDGKDKWPDVQVRATAKTVAGILARNPRLTIDDVVGHSDIAGERKQDPVGYPWGNFRKYVEAYMGRPIENDSEAAQHDQIKGLVAKGVSSADAADQVLGKTPLAKGGDREPVAPLAQPKEAGNTSRQMRATWFGRNPDGSVDTTDEAKMGYYNAHHGAWGADLLDNKLEGVALGTNFLRANGVNPRKDPGSQGYRVRVTAPNGKSEITNIVDLGPENTVDMTYGLGKKLGLSDNSQLKVELLDNQGKSIALRDAPTGGAVVKGGGGGEGPGTAAAKWRGDQFGPGEWLNIPPEAPIAQEEEKPFAQVPGMEEAQREGAATGGGGGGYAEEPATHQTPFASMYPFGMPSAAQMRAPMTQGEAMQQAQQMASYSMQPPAAPGQIFAGPGVSYMPRKGGAAPEEAPEESTLGEPMPKGIGKVTPLLSQGLTGLKQAQQQHAKLLSADDTRVRQQGSGSSARFKGEHFLEGDPVHQAALASVPDQEKTVLAAGQTAIQKRQPMHMTYLSAPPARETPISRQSREVDYDESSPEARLMGSTKGRLAGHSVIPLSVGISTPRKKGEPNRGYIEGISTSAAAHNHALINEGLAMSGEPTPYPEVRSPKFRNDFRGYIQNLMAGHSGTGAKYQVGTEDYPVKPDKKYVPYRLKQKEADFMNAILNNQRARSTPAVRELAQKAGTLRSEEGEVNPIRESIDRAEIKDPSIKYAANERWSKNILEPTIRTFKAGLIKSLHEKPDDLPADLRQNVTAYRKLTGVLSQEMGQKKGWPDIPTAAHFMPAPLSPEEHKELTGNIRKQFISGKLRPKDYLERVGEVPAPGEPLGGGVHYMPMAGPKAQKFGEAQKAGRTFETPLPGGGKRFEIDDRSMEFKPASKAALENQHLTSTGRPVKNALEERYLTDTRGPGKMPLSDAIRHPELFENYPFLRRTQISMDPTIRHSGHYEPPYVDENTGAPKGDHIVLQDPENRGTLAHEIQHAVQHYEDFAGKGTNSDHIAKLMKNDTGVRDELDKVWASAYPERNDMSNEEFAANDKLRTKWMDKRIKEMAFAMYHSEPGEIEARVAGERAMRHPEVTTEPRLDLRSEMQDAEREARRAAIMSPSYGEYPWQRSGTPPRSEGPGISYMPAPLGKGKKAEMPAPAPREISQETQDKLGPRPKDAMQGDLWDKVAARLDSQIPGAMPLEPDRKENGDFKFAKVKDKIVPVYKKTDYSIANSPLLQKAGKALGTVANPKTGKLAMAKAPEDTEDNLAELDPEKRLTPFLNPTDRKRVSHLNKISAVDTFADKLHEMYKSIAHLPEVMGGANWYDEAKELLEHHFGAHADLVANLLGATSAGTNVKVNYGMAMDAYHQFLRGAFDRHIDLYRKADKIRNSGKGALMQHILDNGIHTALGEEAPNTDEAAMAQYIAHHDITPRGAAGNLFGHNSLATLKVLAHTWEREAGGPKTPNFAANLSGRSLQATIDMWAARTMRRLGSEGHTKEPWLIQPAGETGVNDVDFGLSQLAFAKAAKRIGIKPSSLQAILWFAEQKHYQKQGWEREIDPAERDYRPMLKAYQRPEDITKKHVSRAEKVRQKAAGAEAALAE